MNPFIQLRVACYLLLFVAVSAIPFALAQPKATSHGLPSTTILVTNTNDSGSGSLRNALAIANDGDTIDATGISGTILLTSGELQINHNVTINGPGAGTLAINGNATFRVFENFAADVTISGFTITNGHFPVGSPGGGIFNHGGLTVGDSSVTANDGTGINNGYDPSGGTLTVMHSSVSANNGGGINSFGTLTVINSTISDNSTASGAGGIASNGTLAVTNSSISGNYPVGGGLGGGGGISATGTATISNSKINGNQNSGCFGGGLNVYGDVTVISSKISGNSMVDPPGDGISGCVGPPYGGGGIVFGGPTTHEVINSTISGNHADRSLVVGGGIYMVDICPGSVIVTNSTISENSSAIGGGGGFAYECPDGGTAGTFVIENSTFSGNWGPIGGSILNDGGAGTDRRYCPECRCVRRNNFYQYWHGHLPWLQSCKR
jgi:hypothetical protein